jgi:ribosome maturation factor RimP
LGYELLELRFLTEQGRQFLRIMIDREGGISVGDCERISREVETLLEVEEVVKGRYDLEVSSPGLDRPLVKESDFVRYAGRNASLKTREPIEGRRNYKGLLKGMEGGTVVMVIDGKEFRIPIGLVEKAHLVF